MRLVAVASLLLTSSAGLRAGAFAPPVRVARNNHPLADAARRADCSVASPIIFPRGGAKKVASFRPRKPGTDLLAAAAASAESSSPSPVVQSLKAVASTSLFVVLDVSFRRLLKSLSIGFPSSLAGCGALFATLLTVKSLNSEWGDALYGALEPGAGVLAKWLPLFFVPSLVTLPLARSIGSGVELAKIAAVVVGGFFFTLLTTSWSVLGVRALLSDDDSAAVAASDDSDKEAPAAAATPSPPPKPFSAATLNTLTTLAVSFGGAAALAVKTGAEAASVTPLKTLSMLFTTLSTFVFGARLPSKFTKLVHPLVTCTLSTWGGARILGAVTGGASFLGMLGEYKTGALSPLSNCGAGDLLLFMLGPAVVALACQMYDRRKLVAQNAAEVGTAVAVSSVGGLFGTAFAVRLLGIADPILRLCMLSRNITSPLAMAIASVLGADPSLAVSTVVITGLIGANFGASVLDAFGIQDGVARGLGVGAAAHGLGTAAFKDERDAFPFAAIAMALTASACTVLVSVPAVKEALLRVALG